MLFLRRASTFFLLAATAASPCLLNAQQSAPRAVGTVKSLSGAALTLTTSSGDIQVTVGADTKILINPPDAKNLQSATPGAPADIVVGDRALVNGQAGDQPTALHAVRIVLIKSTALAARDASEQADWQRRGTGGIVKTISGSTITVAAGARMLTIHTTPQTEFRRYAADSVNFKNSVAGTLADVHPGDQLRARGDRSADGTAIAAEEVVTGSFDNLSGQIASMDAPNSMLTIKDLATGKTFTVKVTANTDLRSLPPQAAAMLAARNRPGGASAAGAPGGQGGASPEGARRRAGGDLSQLLQRFPTEALTDLQPGTAVLIVASQGQTPTTVTAITLLSGVDALLTAPPGAEPYTLAPWTLATPDAAAGSGGGR